ncbi:hypothetical protein Zmor_020464 [Zophobas morio]|uniref:PH domain-containing protein n=1 Tax=Zophobas morio TaxID=2755281 RepID=A0AA38M9N1_9CUCU|nr:hypothetical protein Zmor_020464 [Zophobas morio]
MDSFTESLLSRARERQKLLENYNGEGSGNSFSSKRVALSQTNLNSETPNKLIHNHKSNSDGNITKIAHQSPTTLVSSDFSSHKTLNIQNDDFNMEIKVSSADNVRVEVQIEEDNSQDSSQTEKNQGGLRTNAKNRLDRLGKLYAGGEDADISSPIHQTEAKFYAETSPKGCTPASTKTKRGLSKLADLAQNFTEYEDDLTSIRKDTAEKPSAMTKKSRKPPAPKPPAPQPSQPSPSKPSAKFNSPVPPPVPAEPSKRDGKFQWDKKVLDSLESQGFSRTESSTRLIYKYDPKREKENMDEKGKRDCEQTKIPPLKQKAPSRTNLIADKAARFESPQNTPTKDPALMSVSERKALFEKNKGTPLIPKAAFAMPTPQAKPDSAKEKNVKKSVSQTPVNQESVSLKAGGIANKVAALFENKSTISQQQIEKNVQAQRKQEMDMLLNRFHKPVEVITEETEYDDNATEETAMIEKTPSEVITVVPSKEERRSSGNKRCSKSDSPKVAAVLNDVKRIKVSPQKAGRLYPSLTDIESVTETENETRSTTPNDNSSFENSFAESDDANTSFGRDILRAVCKNQSSQKNQIVDDSSDLSDVLDDMDDYIDEALAYSGHTDGPSPPKQGRKSPLETSYSFNYKNFPSESPSQFKSPIKTPMRTEDAKNLPTHVVDGDNILPLTHTVSFYRKQQTQTSTTPIRQISRQPLVEETPENNPEEEELIQKKINVLKIEIAKQELIISQTSQALNLCNSTLEFMGSTEQVEAERVLLLATHRRQAAVHEKQRLEIERTIRPQRKGVEQVYLQKGDLTISKIVLPLKQKYVTALAAAGGKGHHVVCLIKYNEQVLPTQLVSTVASSSKNPELELSVPGTITLRDVYSDFTVTLEVYCLQAQEEILPHDIKYHIKKPSAKLTPKKSKQDSRLIRPVKESPAGPQVVRSPTFALMGYVVFSAATTNKKQWSLNNTPSMSPLEGTVEMCISCQMATTIEHRGFLTMFEDVSGFGAWHRRWCLLRGDTLSYWKYPDDEKNTPPINSIQLSESITQHVGPVSRDICARLHTFLLETERQASPHDKDSLITVRKGPRTVIRHLLSADTKEERLEWCSKLNSALCVNVSRKSRD